MNNKNEIKFRAKINKYDNGIWGFGFNLAHIPNQTILYIKLIKWYICIGFMNEDWI